MRVEHLSIDRFRGFDAVVVRPRDHVALVGEPRAGRSDVIAALERVLQIDATRWQVREWDFHAGDLDREIRIEVTLTDLDEGLRQQFLRRLEPWDSATGEIVETSDVDDEIDNYQPALRLRWACTWDRIEERGEQRIEYVKRVANSGANANRVSREDRAALPFKAIRQREPLAVRSEGDFRAMLESDDNADVLDAIRRLIECLAPPARLVLLTDPNQFIYGFRPRSWRASTRCGRGKAWVPCHRPPTRFIPRPIADTARSDSRHTTTRVSRH